MNSLLSLWSTLTPRRRFAVIGAGLAMFVTILALGRLAATPDMALLYSGLDPARSGEVVAALESRNVAYSVRGQAIMVDATQRDTLRMELAAEGLPAQAGAGYELLDTLSGFGTTAQMFDAAWGRAVEGELARTILANPSFRAARVHIARPESQAFGAKAAPTASVVVTTLAGSISQSEARALRHLVAAAVPNLLPDGVEVIDSVAGLVALDPAGPTQASAEQRADAIRANVERLLAARVGAGKAVVQVAIELETQAEQVTERLLDPQGRVAVSTETSTKSGSDSGAGGSVTVASNLPEGADQGGTKSENAENSERTNFDVSETQRAITRVPGDIRRMTVAVLVDGTRSVAEDGTETWQPRSEDELATLQELVTAAVGINADRGDVLTLKTLEFSPLAETGTLATAPSGLLTGSIDLMTLVKLALLAIVASLLGLFVLRPALTARKPAEPLALPETASLALTGEIGPDLSQSGQLIDVTLEPDVDPVTRLRRLIEERQAESVEILRGWMEAEPEKT